MYQCVQCVQKIEVSSFVEAALAIGTARVLGTNCEYVSDSIEDTMTNSLRSRMKNSLMDQLKRQYVQDFVQMGWTDSQSFSATLRGGGGGGGGRNGSSSGSDSSSGRGRGSRDSSGNRKMTNTMDSKSDGGVT